MLLLRYPHQEPLRSTNCFNHHTARAPLLQIALAGAVLALCGHAQAANILKDASGTDLVAGTSWIGSAVPGSADVATWDSSSLGAGLTLGTDLSWSGIGVTGALSDIDISGLGQLTLGAAGIDLSASTVNLTIGNPIAIGADQNWAVNAGINLTVTNTISGINTLNLTGGGVVTLSGPNANTMSSSIFVNNGTLRIGYNRATGGSNVVTVAPGATLDVASFATIAGLNDVSGSGGTVWNNGGGNTTLTLGGTGSNSFNGTLSDGPTYTLGLAINSGVQSLGGGNSYHGATTISGGTLVANSSSGLGYSYIALQGGILDLAIDSSINPNNLQPFNGSGTILSDTFTPGLPGITHTLGKFSVYTNGILHVARGINATGTAGVAFSSNVQLGSSSTATNDCTFDVDTNAVLIFSGSLLAKGALTKTGSGELRVTSNANSARLNTTNTLADGTLSLVGPNTRPLANSPAVFNLNGGTLLLTNNAGVNYSGMDPTIVGGDVTIEQDMNDGTGNGLKAKMYVGSVSAGNLTIGGNTLTVQSAHSGVSNGSVEVFYGSATLTGNATFNLINPPGGGVTVLTFGGSVQGAYGLTKTGNGKLQFSNSNTYGGNTIINGGTLWVNQSTLSTPLIGLAAGTVFDVSSIRNTNILLALTNNFYLADGQTLSNSVGATATIDGNLYAGSGTVSVSYIDESPVFVITNGTFTLTTNMNLTIANMGSPLADGDHLIVSTNTSGRVAGSVPSVTVTGSGIVPGATAFLIVTNNALYLRVSAPTSAPSATAVSLLVDRNISLTVTGAVGSAWSLHATNNLSVARPWPVIQSGTVTTSPFTANDLTATNYSSRFYYFSQP